jgi:hypothetical protein
LHHRKLQMPGWHANWAVLISFSDVECELVIVAHTVMIILFGSSIYHHYAAYRPKALPPTPPQWGLNEHWPLASKTIANCNKLEDVTDSEEIRRIHERLQVNKLLAASTRKKWRYERLADGGAIHVNVLKTGARIRRFFITPMTAADGAHVNITIPLGIGLSCGLEKGRTVHMSLDLSTCNHHTPYAERSELNSRARRLGLLITGSIVGGRRDGAEFTHWLRTPRKEGPMQSEALIDFLENPNVTTRDIMQRLNRRPNTVVWSGASFINSTKVPLGHSASPNQKQPITEPATSPKQSLQVDGKFSLMISQLIHKIRVAVLQKKMRVQPTAHSYFKEHSESSICAVLLSSIRQPVVDILTSQEQLSATKSV